MQSPLSPVAPALRRWLQRTGSLSAHLQALGRRFEVQRLGQAVRPLLPGEARSLGLAPGTRCVVREVVLRVDGRPLVYARSVAPARALQGPWRSLGSLGTRPLAQLLFDTPAVRRSPLQAEHLAPGSVWQQHVRRAWQLATGEDWPSPGAWARHSVFTKAGVPLRVTEVFHPALHRSPCPPAAGRPAQTTRTASRGSPSTAASSKSPRSTAATPSGVPV